ncbi:c-type cytochrome [Wenxinia saemankumensis]|uniref:Cytochrome c n=1 Tax=Wenxinia saemankumensis TaxID=1447782 RepID=A0A1M6ANX2_9RHOB|nr:cytochrome c [Wenxinia saemankumensis]SHI38204.1 Cytochrome c [Wenxinia saemankumensis]
MRIALALALVPIALAGCMPQETPSGALLFAESCAACHGPAGQGDGPAASGLDPAPADLTGLSDRNGGTFPMEYVLSTIDGYGRTVPAHSGMPAFGEGDLGPTVVVEFEDGVGTPVPAQLLALAEYLRSLQD